MSTGTLQHYRVTVALPRPSGNRVLLPPDAHALAEAAAAAVGAVGLMTAWTSAKVLLSMTVKVPREADALSAGRAVARTLGGAHGASVEAEPVPRRGAVSGGLSPLRPPAVKRLRTGT
jgi:hypothetical protein